jgi:hypothetical protein
MPAGGEQQRDLQLLAGDAEGQWRDVPVHVRIALRRRYCQPDGSPRVHREQLIATAHQPTGTSTRATD